MFWEEIWILRASLLTAACVFMTVEPISGGLRSMEAFWSKPSVKLEIKITWEVVSTREVLWSARLNTSKVTRNRREDRYSQWEATKRSVALSTARVIGAHRDRYQQRWTATVRQLICVNVRRMGPDGIDWNGDRHRNISMTVEVVWRCMVLCIQRRHYVIYEVVGAQLLAFARLLNFV